MMRLPGNALAASPSIKTSLGLVYDWHPMPVA
jgi:hypothetical protein